jgi:integrase
LAKQLWIVPRERMKAGLEHRVPLLGAAMAILNKAAAFQQEGNPFVFVGLNPGKALSVMVLEMVLRRMKARTSPCMASGPPYGRGRLSLR